MNTKKWKSVVVPIEVYTVIAKEAQREGRTKSGQLRYMLDVYQAASSNGDSQIERIH